MTPALFDQPGVRPYQIHGDAMSPALRSGDFLMVAPAQQYEGEAVYLLDFGGGEAPYISQRLISRGETHVLIRHPNPIYTRHSISLGDFVGAVRARVVAEVRLHRGLHELAEARGNA